MANFDINPIQVVSEKDQDLVYFDNLLFRSQLTNANSMFTGDITVDPAPTGVATVGDTYKLLIPQNITKATWIDVFLTAHMRVVLKNPETTPRNDIVFYGNTSADTIKIDGVPYFMRLTPSDPLLSLQRTAIQNILLSTLQVLYSMDTVNSLTTPFFTLDLVGNVHSVYFYLKPTIKFKR